MTIEIHTHDGDYDYYPVARFEDNTWVEGGDEIDPAGYYEGTSEEIVEGDFDGPDTVAVDPSVMVEPGEEAEKSDDRVYVDNVDEAPDDAVVHCEPGDDGELYYNP